MPQIVQHGWLRIQCAQPSSVRPRRRIAAWLSLVLSLGCCGCSSESPRLLIEVRSDLVPSSEIDEVRIALFRNSDGAPIREAATPIRAADPLATGKRVADFENLAIGSYVVVGEAWLSGERQQTQTIPFRLDGDRAIQIRFDSACAEVICPSLNDPSATICVAGSCQPPPCATANDCTMSEACAQPLCNDGICSEDFSLCTDAAIDADAGVDADAQSMPCMEGASECANDMATRCEGGVELTELCEFGCAGDRCLWGLPSIIPADSWMSTTDVRITRTVRVDTDTCAPEMGVARLVVPSSGSPLCVWSTGNLTIAPGATVIATGSAALSIAAFGDVRIMGRLGVGAEGVTPGAGGSRGGGTARRGEGPGGGMEGRTSGGAGGSHVTSGGVGRGAGTPLAGPTTLCKFPDRSLQGGSGGGGGTGLNAGEGGAGGGAIQIAATGTITLGGTLSAGGGGGRGGSGDGSGGGGGGGGAGGTILLEAAQLQLGVGRLLVGGGGGGASGRSGVQGRDGEDAQTTPLDRAAGGAASSDGGNGGSGAGGPAAKADPGGMRMTATLPGGGGGGGSGCIALRGPEASAASPMPSPFAASVVRVDTE
ncbi:MAG: hypothetical protein AAGF12_09130 [Myxococcota bacterium]